MKCESCTKYDDCRTGSGLTWPCGAYRPKAGSGTDIEKLIERLRNNNIENNCHDCALGYYAFEAATALSTLQAENAKLRAELEQNEKYYEQMVDALAATESAELRAELEYEKEHANAYYEECGQWEAENEKLRAELEQVKAALRREQDGE